MFTEYSVSHCYNRFRINEGFLSPESPDPSLLSSLLLPFLQAKEASSTPMSHHPPLGLLQMALICLALLLAFPGLPGPPWTFPSLPGPPSRRFQDAL